MKTPTWREILGFKPRSRPRPEQIESAFRALARKHHPDVGGSHATMSLLNTARDAARAARGPR